MVIVWCIVAVYTCSVIRLSEATLAYCSIVESVEGQRKNSKERRVVMKIRSCGIEGEDKRVSTPP